MKLRTILLRCISLGLFGWILNAPQALSQITLTCNPADTLVECPALPGGGIECHNCHPILFPTAITSCAQGGLSVTFIGSEVIAPPSPPNVPFAIPMDTVTTSGDFAYATIGFGTIRLYFSATDSCGNTATCSYDFTNIPIVPVMEFSYCPDNITVLAPIGQTNVVVTFDSPVYESNCFPYLLSQVEGPVSGSPFPYSVTAIKWAAAHVLGTDFCDFTVTVLPPGSNTDTLCQREYSVSTDDVICVNTTATDGLSVVTVNDGVFMRHELSATGILLGSLPQTVDSINAGVFQLIPLNIGAPNARTQILRLASDGSVAYVVEIEGTVSAFFRSPCAGDFTYILQSAITSAAVQKFTHEIRLGPTEASILYRCDEFIPPPTIAGVFYTTTSWTLLPDGGKIFFSLRNVTSSNTPLDLPLGRTFRVWRTNSIDTMLWETALNPVFPAVHCMRLLERPGQNFILAGIALPDGQLWTYQSDCVNNILPPDLQIGNLAVINPIVTPGEVMDYIFDLSNPGTGPALGEFTVKTWFSTDNTLSPDDVQDGVVSTGNFSAGQVVQQVQGASTVPASLAPGDYYLILKVDADDQIIESNDSNNIIITAGAVVKVQVSSTSEPAETIKMQISPNPTHGMFRLDLAPELTGHTGLLLEVYDIYGRQMYRQSLNAVSQQMVSLPEGLANGCYVLHLRLPDDNSAVVRRIALLR